jgi:hypothetical protein
MYASPGVSRGLGGEDLHNLQWFLTIILAFSWAFLFPTTQFFQLARVHFRYDDEVLRRSRFETQYMHKGLKLTRLSGEDLDQSSPEEREEQGSSLT